MDENEKKRKRFSLFVAGTKIKVSGNGYNYTAVKAGVVKITEGLTAIVRLNQRQSRKRAS